MRLKLHRDQRGFEPVMLIVIVVVLLVLVGGGYYFFTKQKDSDNTGALDSAASKELRDACNKAYDDKDFCRFASNWSFGGEMKMTVTSPEDETVTVFETDGNGNTRMSSTQGGSEQYASITIGQTTYIKNTDEGNWMKYEAQETDSPVGSLDDIKDDFSFDEEVTKDTTRISGQGKEACGNLTCFKYSMTDSSAPGEETIVWFDDKDYRLRRMTSTSSDGFSEMTFEYEVADISAPSPVVEMPAFDEDMSAEELRQLMEQFGN